MIPDVEVAEKKCSHCQMYDERRTKSGAGDFFASSSCLKVDLA